MRSSQSINVLVTSDGGACLHFVDIGFAKDTSEKCNVSESVRWHSCNAGYSLQGKRLKVGKQKDALGTKT